MACDLNSADTEWGLWCCCEHGSELLGSSEVWGFVDKLSECQLLKKFRASWNCLIRVYYGWELRDVHTSPTIDRSVQAASNCSGMWMGK
jgi:hypothetical protein